ncbi:MAG TPA: energy transducer TonB [Caulobacteraceae bacterium]|jgi:TonB family protein
MILGLVLTAALTAAGGQSDPIEPRDRCPSDEAILGFSHPLEFTKTRTGLRALPGYSVADCQVMKDRTLGRCRVLYAKNHAAKFSESLRLEAQGEVASKFPLRSAGSRFCFINYWNPPQPIVVAPPVALLPPVVHPVRVINNPDWIRRPNGEDFVTYYPPTALEAGAGGHTAMECLVESDGSLSNCRIISETPTDMGFGAATLRLASRFRMRPQTVDGQSVRGARVVIPIAWKVEDEPPPPPPVIVAPGLGGASMTAAPQWAQLPSDVDLSLVRPASEQGAAGAAVMICSVGGDGSLSGCVIDTASSDAFAAAALRLANKYRVRIVTPEEGGFINARVKVWVAWPSLMPPPIAIPAPPPHPDGH